MHTIEWVKTATTMTAETANWTLKKDSIQKTSSQSNKVKLRVSAIKNAQLSPELPGDARHMSSTGPDRMAELSHGKFPFLL